MKYFIASDIHGSSFYCKKLVKAIENENPDKIFFLGDILYHGPRNDLPKEYNPKIVIDLLNPLKNKVLCVKGNCDAEVDQMVLDFEISEQDFFLEEENYFIYATHGHHINFNNFFDFHHETKNSKKIIILLNGHTHIPSFEKKENLLYVNDGSVSIPKENSQNCYVILQDNKIFWKNLEGQIFKTVNF